MNDLSIFAFGDCMIRTIKKDDETWFVGRDVAIALEYAKPENALATHVDNDDKTGLSKKKWAALIILNLQENSNLLKFKYEQRRKR